MLRKKIKIESNVYSIGNVSEQAVSDSSNTDSPPSPVICYSRGLKAMMDVFPDNTDAFSTQTIDGYLWVIEQLLMNIYSLYEGVAEEKPNKVIANLSRYAQEISSADVHKFPSDQLEY
ncbi:MAG TPA: hypothetical protein ENJ08_02740 [Gammaproteobacteria bacterium]|nr:hypothetical protein [Gammaproteobacteria bacterium]